MKFKKHIVLLFAAILGLASCAKEEAAKSSLVVPDVYLELLSEHRDGMLLLSYTFVGTSTIFTFEDNIINVPQSELHIYDLSDAANIPSIILGSDGKWMIKGAKTNIPSTKGKTAEQSYPLYCYIMDGTLHIFVTNGELIDFKAKVSDSGDDSEDDPGDDAEKFVVPEAESYVMPKIYLTHSADRVHKSYAIDGTFEITDPSQHYSEISDYTCAMTMQGRGNSTWGMAKQPYKIKLAEKTSLLGMPANKDWILLANYADKSLLRNAVAMKTSEMLDMSWTPRYRNVEVYLNNEYVGVYNLFESKEVAKHKVDLDLEAGEIYLEIESTQDDHVYFCTSKCGVPIQFQEPEEPTDEQISTVKTLFNNFENVLYSSSFSSKTVGYSKYIDVDSFINFYIIEELAKDIDGNIRKSSFMSYKPSTGKLAFYHVWDFDLCYGNANYFPTDQDGCDGDANGPKGWWIKDYGSGSVKDTGWYYRLFLDRSFVKQVQDRWNEVYPNLSKIDDYIDYWVKEMGSATTRNFQKWDILGYAVWPNVVVPGSYSGEISYLKEFYNERLEWLNTNINNL